MPTGYRRALMMSAPRMSKRLAPFGALQFMLASPLAVLLGIALMNALRVN